MWDPITLGSRTSARQMEAKHETARQLITSRSNVCFTILSFACRLERLDFRRRFDRGGQSRLVIIAQPTGLVHSPE